MDLDKEYEALAAAAIKVLRNFAESKANTETQIKKAAIMNGALSNSTRHFATKSAREQTGFQVARTLAKDRKQLAEFVNLTMPSSPVARALAARNK